MKNEISSRDINMIGESFVMHLEKYIKEMFMPKLEDVYKKLKNHPIYDVELDRMDNLRNLFYCGDSTYYAGIINPDAFEHNKRAIYFHMDTIQFVLQFIDKPYDDSFKDTIHKGIRTIKVFNPLDIECIEKSWGVKTTEHWATQLDLTAKCFTDQTKHSQKIEKHIVSHRPTLKRYIKDHNEKHAFDYEPILSTCSMFEGNTDISEINSTMFAAYAIGRELKVPGMDI